MLPVVILSGTSFYFLREDRGAIEQDARERAQRLAPPMAGAFGSRIAELVRGNARGEIASNGGIVSPKDYAPLPEPAAWPGELSPSLAASWAEAQDAIFRRQDKPAARRILRRLSSAPASRALRLKCRAGIAAARSGCVAGDRTGWEVAWSHNGVGDSGFAPGMVDRPAGRWPGRRSRGYAAGRPRLSGSGPARCGGANCTVA